MSDQGSDTVTDWPAGSVAPRPTSSVVGSVCVAASTTPSLRVTSPTVSSMPTAAVRGLLAHNRKTRPSTGRSGVNVTLTIPSAVPPTGSMVAMTL